MIAEQEKIALLAVRTAECGILRKLVLSQPIGDGGAIRESGKLCMHRARRIFMFEEQFDGGRVSQKLIEHAELYAELAAVPSGQSADGRGGC